MAILKEVAHKGCIYATFVWAILLLAAWVFPVAEAAEEPNEDIMVLTWDQETQKWHMPPEKTEEPEKKETISRIPYSIPAEENGAKRWMDYRTITSKSSKQWRIQQEAWTDEFGFRRVGDAYCIAMGTYYTMQGGVTFEITLDSGFSFQGVISDIKRDRDTDSTNRHKDGNVVEFIIDKNVIPRDAKVMGDMSYGGTPMRGKITAINKISPIMG